MRILRYSCFLFLILLACSRTFAQSDKIMWHGGFGYQFATYQLANTLTPSTELDAFYGLTFGMNYVTWHKDDKFSLGVDPNMLASIRLLNNGLDLFLQSPIFAMAHVGNGSTPFNSQRIGLGIGAGIIPSYEYIKSFSVPGASQWLVFVNPGMVAEINIAGGMSDYKLRANWSLAKYPKEIFGTEYKFGTFGFSLLYAF